MAEIGDDEGILGNDFAMAHKLTVRLCEGCVYLPDLSGTRKEHMGERLPCTIRSVTEVRAITEETPGYGTGDAGTTHSHPSTSDRSYSWSERNGDDRHGAWTVGAVPSPMSS